MELEVRLTLKRVFSFDIAIMVMAYVVSHVFFKSYEYIVILGLILSTANFTCNAFTTSYLLSQSKNKSLTVFISAFRIIITLSIVILLCGNDKFKYIAIIAGYTLHYLAIILHGLTLKN